MHTKSRMNWCRAPFRSGPLTGIFRRDFLGPLFCTESDDVLQSFTPARICRAGCHGTELIPVIGQTCPLIGFYRLLQLPNREGASLHGLPTSQSLRVRQVCTDGAIHWT